MTTPGIRDFEPADAGRIWDILEVALAAYGLHRNPESSDRDLEDVIDSYVTKGGAFRVLEVGGVIGGMYGLRNEGGGTAELRKMYLDPTQKRKGYGMLMLEDAISVAEGLGFRQITLETNKLLVEAIGLYRKYGFVESSRVGFSDQCNYAMKLDLR